MESLKNRLWNLKDPHGSPTGVNNKLNPQMTSPPAYEPKPQKWPHPGKGVQRSDGDNQMGEKIESLAPPSLPTTTTTTHTHRDSQDFNGNPINHLDETFTTPQKNPNFQALKFSHRGLNDMTRLKTKKGS